MLLFNLVINGRNNTHAHEIIQAVNHASDVLLGDDAVPIDVIEVEHPPDLLFLGAPHERGQGEDELLEVDGLIDVVVVDGVGVVLVGSVIGIVLLDEGGEEVLGEESTITAYEVEGVDLDEQQLSQHTRWTFLFKIPINQSDFLAAELGQTHKLLNVKELLLALLAIVLDLFVPEVVIISLPRLEDLQETSAAHCRTAPRTPASLPSRLTMT